MNTTAELVRTLATYIAEQEGISSAWNGEDYYYYHEGEQYHEDDAHIAQERAIAAREFKNKLESDNI